MREKLLSAARSADVVHNNSFWMFQNVYPYQVVRQLRRAGKRAPKFVNAPRGTLAAWSLNRHAWQKRLFGLFAGQYAAMRATDMWHATCEKECEEIRAAGFGQPVAIVPIGMEIPRPTICKRPATGGNPRRVAFFGRLHQVKRVDWLLRAWEIVMAEAATPSPSWELVIAGPDGGIRGELESYVASHHLPRVSFAGEINGPAKYEFLASADLYVLPSATENFGITLAEALACGTPSIGSRGTPWKELNECRCGSWGFDSVEELAVELRKMMSLSDEDRTAMGERGRELIRTRYSWESIGEKMNAAYEWLCHGGEKPNWVQTE